MRRFWELVDPRSLFVHPHPGLTTPEFALQTWRAHVSDLPGMVPRVLFPIAYESWSHLFVELDGPDADDGGAIFSWAYGGHSLRFVFGDVIGMLDEVTSAVIDGRVDRRAGHLYVSGPSWVDQTPTVALHPMFGAIDSIPEEVTQWPEAWQLRSQITPERRTPAGADHTIAEVLEQLDRGPVTARIHATVTGLGGSGEGTRVTVTDGTGEMRIWCPASATALGPGLGRTFEFHIRAPANNVPQTPDFAALAGPEYAHLPIDMGDVIDRLTSAAAPVHATAIEIRATEAW